MSLQESVKHNFSLSHIGLSASSQTLAAYQHPHPYTLMYYAIVTKYRQLAGNSGPNHFTVRTSEPHGYKQSKFQNHGKNI